jgi:hypothetical protein
MWAIVNANANCLNRDTDFSWYMNDHSERTQRIMAICGCVIITALNELDRIGQLKKDSQFLNLGYVMAIFLLRGIDLEDLLGEGTNIEYPQSGDRERHFGVVDWAGVVIAYAKKADIDLSHQGVAGLGEILERTTAANLDEPAKAERWQWTALVSGSLEDSATPIT